MFEITLWQSEYRMSLGEFGTLYLRHRAERDGHDVWSFSLYGPQALVIRLDDGYTTPIGWTIEQVFMELVQWLVDEPLNSAHGRWIASYGSEVDDLAFATTL